MGKVQGVGAKACTQCGTTRTPQWREGPLGPKTLCNACGVKRVRSMRAPQEHSARRKSTAAPRARAAAAVSAPAGAGAKRAQALVTQLPPHSELLRAVERSSTGEDILEPAAPAAAPKRQRRAAAVKAASRAQEFATTGHWPSDNDEPITVPIATLSGPAASGSQHHSDDSAEEEVWGPPSGPLPLLSHPSMKMGESSSAAIGLLAMSLPEEEVKAASRSTSPLTDRAPAPPSGPNAADAATGDATNHAAGPLGGLGQTLARAAWAHRNLPKDKSPQLTRLLRRAAAAYSTAVEAEAPVLATARLLAAKQAVLSRSLSEARDAAGELDEYIRRAAGPLKAPPS